MIMIRQYCNTEDIEGIVNFTGALSFVYLIVGMDVD